MRTKLFVAILVLLALAVPASTAHAGGIVSVCDEAHLRAALVGGGTVTFSCSGTITLTTQITIAADTTIDGGGQAVTISGNNAVRVFKVNSGITLSLDELTVVDASTPVYPDDYGGGIYSLGTVEVSNSTFAGNSAGAGGGIYNDHNAILIVSNSTFFSNSTRRIAGNGGGIYNNDNAILTVSNSTFFGNSAIGYGGGIHNNFGMLAVINSTFSANSAGWGGGIRSEGGTLTVSSSTFSGNSSAENGGGIDNHGTLTVSNSTFSSNSAIASYWGEGGGISNTGTLTVSNSTFSGNSAAFLGGGIYNNPPNGTVMLQNAIVANSPAGSNCYGAITDGGGNLSYPDATCPGINANPLLSPLQNNSGPTQTMALGAGSAAIDAGIDAICAAPPVNNLDQRGVIRPQGPHCDIGAYERQVFGLWFPFARAQ